MNKAHEKLITGWIYETARRLHTGNEYVVERDDLVQQGWVTALVAYESWEESGGTKLQTWIVSQLRRDMARYVEREKSVRQGHVDIDDFVEVDGVDELIDYDEQVRLEQLTEVSRLAEVLDDRELEVIRLYYFEDLSEQEIGDIQGVSRSMIQKVHQRALKKMRDRGISLEG